MQVTKSVHNNLRFNEKPSSLLIAVSLEPVIHISPDDKVDAYTVRYRTIDSHQKIATAFGGLATPPGTYIKIRSPHNTEKVRLSRTRLLGAACLQRNTA